MGRGGRYPPLAFLGVVLFLVLTVLPSALTLPQTNPSTTLEYAPVPPSDSDAAPPGGNVSSLGLATSGSLVSPADGEAAALLAPDSKPGGVGKNPSTKRCVGNPPRQTEDPLSPPCVAYFQGDNFGGTYQGVTRDEIRILFYLQGGIGRAPTNKGYEYGPGGLDSSQPLYYDLAQPPARDEDVLLKVLRAFQRYFNDRYQTYNRFVHFYAYYSPYQSPKRPEARRAEAADNYNWAKPFAVLSYAQNGNEDVYLEEMARRGVLNFGSAFGRETAFFRQFPKLIWGYPPTLEVQARQFSNYVCRQVVGLPVTFSGNAEFQNKPRKLGLLSASNDAYPGMRKFAKLVKQQVEACGGRFEVERTFPSVYFVVNPSYPPTYAAENMAAFQRAGVTTIIWAQGSEIDQPKAAARMNYYPEYVVAGDGTHDGWGFSSYQDQSAWRHAWVVSNTTLDPPVDDSRCFRAVQEVDPETENDGRHACNVTSFYNDLRQLMTGIQVAGPRLSPDTIDKGFHAIPAVASDDPTVPACFYDPGDYTCVKDAIPMWWDSNSVNPRGSTGCWRVPLEGKRYLADGWPRRDVAADRNAATDPCNAYQGSYQV